MAKPKFILYGDLICTRPIPESHKKASREWAEHQALANYMRDEPAPYDFILSLLPVAFMLLLISLGLLAYGLL